MKEVSGYNISEQEFKKISKWAEDIYNIAVIIDYFVGNQPEIEECYNLAPVVKNLRNNADLLNAFFIWLFPQAPDRDKNRYPLSRLRQNSS